MGRASRAVAFGAVFALLVSACTGGGTPTPRPNATESPIPRGGTLRVGLFHWNRDFPYDPATFWTFEILSIYPCCLLRTLYYYNGRSAAEGGGELRPDLATGPPEVSSDGLTWTFHIRLGLHYAPPLQRVEITASDFVRAIERQLSPAPKEFHSPNGLLGFGSSDVLVIEGAQDYADGKSDRISGLEAPDSHTLRIRLTEPDGDFPFRLSLVGTTPIPPNPFHPEARLGVAEGHSLDGYGRFLVSSGPYMIEGSQKIDFSVPPDQQQPPSGLDPLVLVRNPSWRPSSDPLRPAYPDRIEFTASDSKPYTVDEFFAIPDTAVRKYRLAYAKRVETGDIDVVGDWGATTEEARRYQADPSLKSRLGVYEFNIVRFLSLNVALPPFNDVHVRRAVNYVIDKKRVLEAWQLSEAGAITDHLAPNDTEDNLLVNYHPYPSPDHAGNLSAAQREMKLSAYDRNGDGTCDRPACDLGTVLWRGDGPQPDIARIVRQDLTKIGIRFVPKLVDSGEMYKACGDPTAHANLCQVGWVAGYPSASTFFPGLYSTDVLGSCCNYSVVGATSEQLRAWHYKVASVPNVDDRMKACKEAVGISHMQCWVAFDQYLMEEVVPAVPLWIDAAPWTFSSRVAAFSWDQVAGEPALDKIALKPST